MLSKASDCLAWNMMLLRKNIRLYLCILLGFFICFFLSDRVMMLAHQFDVSVQIFEPFIWCFSEADNVLFSSFALILVLTQMPQLGNSAAQLVFKKGKAPWLMGQVMTAVLLSVLFSIFMMLCTLFIASSNCYTQNKWSNLATILSYDKAGFEAAITFTRRTIKLTMPYTGMLNIFLLFLQYSLFLSLCNLTVALKWGKKIAMCVLVAISVWGYLLNPQRLNEFFKLPEQAMYYVNAFSVWLSPLQQAVYPMHNFGFDILPTVLQSHMIFLVVNLVFIISSHFAMKGEMYFE